MIRLKDRDNVRALYTLGTLSNDGSGSYQSYTTIDKAVFNFSTPEAIATPNSFDPNNYTAKENVIAYYLQGKYNVTPRLQIIGGARYESTTQEWHSQLDPRQFGKDGTVSYPNILPSLHIKYALSKEQNIRFSYYAALSRPSYYEFVPIQIQGDVFTEQGNPRLDHATTADNFDLRYEKFWGGSNQILAGVFYKSIKDPIELFLVRTTVSNSNIIPAYTPSANNYGFEFVIAKYIRNWGISANYTFTQSSVTTTKRYKSRVSDGKGGSSIVTTDQDQKRPLQGQSNHIANASLIYKNPTLGLDAQLSWVYTGRRINLVSPYVDLDYWQRGFSQLDFSAEKSFLVKFKLFAKITNLLDTPLTTEVFSPNYLNPDAPAQDRSDRIVVQKDVFHQTFLAGVRYKF